MPVGHLGIMAINEAPPPLDLSPEEIAALAAELVDDHAVFADLDYRQEQAHWGDKSWHGLMRPLERTSIEPLALALDGGDVQALPPLSGQGPWQDDLVRRRPWRVVADTLGDADGVSMVEGSDGPKPGESSVGVARQWCGHVGTVDHGQAGVFAAYASRHGDTRLDRRLDRPEAWCEVAHRERWGTCGIPAETLVKTQPALALEMVPAIVTEGGLRCRGLTCDAACGRDGALLDGVAALGRWSVADVPHATQVWLTRPATAVPTWRGRGRRPRQARLVPGDPAPPRVDHRAAAVPLDEWHPYLSTAGSTGPLVAEFACQRGVAVRAGLPGPAVWLGFRRGLGENPALQVSRRHAPAHTPVTALVRVAGRRWPMETAFEESQGGLGLDHDEVRSWLGWHHHMTLGLLAPHCLVRARQRVNKGRRR